VAGRPRATTSAAEGRACVFLDRDGVLNELIDDPVSGVPESPLRVADVCLIPGAAAAAGRLQRLGFALVCVSNQPAAAKGRVSEAELLAVHDRVIELLRQQGVELAASRVCLHHEHGTVAELTGPCECRKPAPGMLIDAARTLGIDLSISWMVGDTDADVEAGRAAGCGTVSIRNPASIHKRLQAFSPDLEASSLSDAATLIAAQMRDSI
jgi:D-glycero-D-manno-heptose 1,7-bisphosphate phosphatase